MGRPASMSTDSCWVNWVSCLCLTRPARNRLFLAVLPPVGAAGASGLAGVVEGSVDLRDVVHGRVDGGRDTGELQLRMRKRDGEYLHILARAVVVDRRDDGSAVRIVGTDYDITDAGRQGEQVPAANRDQKRALAVEDSGSIQVSRISQDEVRDSLPCVFRSRGDWPGTT